VNQVRPGQDAEVVWILRRAAERDERGPQPVSPRRWIPLDQVKGAQGA
jgi:hypothetical protein